MAEHLSEKRVDELKAAFEVFDQDGDGRISAADFVNGAQRLGIQVSESQLRISGSIDFKEFLNKMAGLSTRSLNDAEIDYKAAFNAFDKDGDGSITHDDIKSILASLNEDITAAEIDEIVKEADVDGSNKINYEEYVKLMVENS